MKRQASKTRQDYEKKPVIRLRRLAKSLDPDHIAKRKNYAAKTEVKQRRQELNRQRRLLSRTLINLLKNGQLYLAPDIVSNKTVPLGLSFNRIVAPDEKKFAYIDKDSITWHPYTNELDLANLKMEFNIKEDDKEFQELLKRFIDGDPEVINQLQPKKPIRESKPLDYEVVRIMVKQKLLKNTEDIDDSDSSSNDE